MKKLFSLLMGLILLLSVIAITVPQNVKANDLSPFSVVDEMIKYENSSEWSKIPNLWSQDRKDIYSSFVENKENLENKIGMFNIKKAEITNWKELDPEYVSPYTDVKQEAKFYYVAVNTEVHREDTFFVNGINYHLVAVVLENGNWKIAQFSTAPVDIFEAEGKGFGTYDEREMANMLKQRHHGKIINRQGEIIGNGDFSPRDESVSTTYGLYSEPESEPEPDPVETEIIIDDPSIDQNSEPAQTTDPDSSEIINYSIADHKKPTYIKVYMTSSHNKTYYGCYGCTRSIVFDTYVDNVLPNEWVSSWPANSLRVGAYAAKMYGWYAVYYPLANAVGAHVYDDTRSQVYKAATSKSSTNSAVDYTNGKGIHRRDNKALFLTEYRAGYYRSGGKSLGIVWQNGTNYWANQGKSVTWMLSYYYDGSSKVGGTGRTFEYFSY
jgi:Stage II sporulation protein